MEDITELGDSKANHFKRTQDTVRSADSGIDTGTTTASVAPSPSNQAPTQAPTEPGMAQAVQEYEVSKPKEIISEGATADEISKLTKSNNKEKTREIDVSNRIKEYRIVSKN